MSKLSATASLLLRATEFWKNEALRLALALDSTEILEAVSENEEASTIVEDEHINEKPIPVIDATPNKARFAKQ